MTIYTQLWAAFSAPVRVVKVSNHCDASIFFSFLKEIGTMALVLSYSDFRVTYPNLVNQFI